MLSSAASQPSCRSTATLQCAPQPRRVGHAKSTPYSLLCGGAAAAMCYHHVASWASHHAVLFKLHTCVVQLVFNVCCAQRLPWMVCHVLYYCGVFPARVSRLTAASSTCIEQHSIPAGCVACGAWLVAAGLCCGFLAAGVVLCVRVLVLAMVCVV
jgi:hypothetical protein